MNLASFPDSMVENGKLHGLISGYTTVDGVVHDLTDVWFQQGAQVALQLVSNGQSLDLATVDTARLHEVDRIDLTGVDIDTLTLSLQGVLEIGARPTVPVRKAGSILPGFKAATNWWWTAMTQIR